MLFSPYFSCFVVWVFYQLVFSCSLYSLMSLSSQTQTANLAKEPTLCVKTEMAAININSNGNAIQLKNAKRQEMSAYTKRCFQSGLALQRYNCFEAALGLFQRAANLSPYSLAACECYYKCAQCLFTLVRFCFSLTACRL